MKIAFAIEHFSPDQGGAEQYAWAFAHWLVECGHELDVFTLHAPQHANFVSAMHILDIGSDGGSRQERVARALRAALARKKYHIVQGFNHVRPCDVLRLGGGVHAAFEEYNALSTANRFERRVKTWSHRVLPRYRALRLNEQEQFDDPRRHFIAVSHRVAADMTHYYPSSAGRIHVIHNGVDLLRFNPNETARRRAAARKSLGYKDDEVVLLFVSNNYRLKGLHDLLHALSLLRAKGEKSLRLLVAGRGQSAPFARLASRLSVRDETQFTGSIADLRDGYAAADVLVHPSYYDAFGFVGLEAMACGLPVVCSRNCGVSEIMTDGQGAVLVQMPCGHGELADAIARAAAPSFRDRAKELNRTRAEQYPLDMNYAKVVDLYDSMSEGAR